MRKIDDVRGCPPHVPPVIENRGTAKQGCSLGSPSPKTLYRRRRRGAPNASLDWDQRAAPWASIKCEPPLHPFSFRRHGDFPCSSYTYELRVGAHVRSL
ncbi:hypothetical protein MTO96_014644 [Rhipicephalus appendiculatus]